VKPETEHRIPVLDGWRGLAIIGVLIDHFVSSEGLNFGRFGVELFFVLSGRLMADILFVRETPLKVFFPRRFSRIYPALFCFATILFVVANLFHPFDISPSVYLSSLFFTMNYVAIFWDVTPATDHLWSLSIEEHCYLLLGLLAAITRWRRGFPYWWVIVALIALAILNGVYQTYVGRLHYHNVYWRTDVRGASLLISVAFYLWLRPRDPRPWLLAQGWTPVAFFLAGLALNINAVPDPIKYSLGTLCLAVSVSTLAQAPAPVAAVLRSRVLTMFGVGSYSLYLWQQPFALIATPALRYASLLFIGVVAWASYNGIEQPARRALNRLLAPRLHPDRVAVAASGD
jgi:peptidoglycan/LPS O-acetylase OafA/YrhL